MRPTLSDAKSSVPVVAILAGGHGSRLGGHKPGTQLGGRPLISYALASAHQAGLETVVVAKPQTLLPEVSERVIYDRERLVHPLSGVLAALNEYDAVIALACDMPFVPPALLRMLAGRRDTAVVTRPGSFLQPFPALYRAACEDSMYQSLMSERSMQATIKRLNPTVIEQAEVLSFGTEERIFFGVNTPEDLLKAAGWLSPTA